MRSLYDISGDLAELLAMLQDDDAPLQAITDTMEAVQMELADKLDGCAAVLRTLKAEVDALKAEEGRLAARRRSRENNIVRLRSAMLLAMQAGEQKKVKTAVNTFCAQERTKLEYDESKIPDDYWQTVRKLDKSGISKIVKSGADVPGVETITTTTLAMR